MIKFEKPDMVSLSKKALTDLLSAPDGCLKIYIYGSVHEAGEMKDIMNELGMEKSEFLDCLEFLEKGGYLNVDVSGDTVFSYAAVEAAPQYSGDIYPDSQFNMLLQSLFSDRELGYRELRTFYECTEVFGLPKKVVLMLAEYCINTHKRGNRLPASYITKKAREWAKDGIDSVEAAQRRMNTDGESANGAKEVLFAMGIRNREPSEAEAALYGKWTQEWGMELPAIRKAMGEMTKIGQPNMHYLDTILQRLYEERLTGSAQIEEHLKENAAVDELIKGLLRELGAARLTVAPDYREKYRAFLGKGFDHETMLYAAKNTAARGAHTMAALGESLADYAAKRLFTKADIIEYEKKLAKTEALAAEMLRRLGLERRPTKADVSLYRRFAGEYGMPHEVILFAAEKALRYQNPPAAMASMLNRWNTKGVKDLEAAKAADESFRNTSQYESRKPDYKQREYSSGDYEARARRAVKAQEDIINDDFADI